MRHKIRKKLLDTIREALARIEFISQKLNSFLNFQPIRPTKYPTLNNVFCLYNIEKTE